MRPSDGQPALDRKERRQSLLFKAASNVAGILFHLPSGQIKQVFFGRRVIPQPSSFNPQSKRASAMQALLLKLARRTG
jgi:hypothetical protein